MGVRDGARGVTAEMPAVGGGRDVQMSFVDFKGNVCTWRSHMRGGVMRSGSGGGCLEPRAYAEALAHSPAIYHGFTGGTTYGFLSGSGRSDLVKVLSEIPGVRVDSAVTEAWAPGGNVPDGFTLKGFMVRFWMGPGVPFPSLLEAGSRSRNLDLVGIFANGDTAPVVTVGEAQGRPVLPSRIVDPIWEPGGIQGDGMDFPL
jgi:hypothetical protein